MRKLNAVWKIYERNVDPEKLTKVASKSRPSATANTELEGTSSTWQNFSHFQSIPIPLPAQRVDRIAPGITLIAHPLVQGPLRRCLYYIRCNVRCFTNSDSYSMHPHPWARHHKRQLWYRGKQAFGALSRYCREESSFRARHVRQQPSVLRRHDSQTAVHVRTHYSD